MASSNNQQASLSYQSTPIQGAFSHHTPVARPTVLSRDTPCMLVDVDLMNSNVKKMMAIILPTGVKVRPHLKTTKCTYLASLMNAEGATGGCVAKLSEAEAFIAQGFNDLLITSPVVGKAKVSRLVEMIENLYFGERGAIDLRVVIDDEANASELAAYMRLALRDIHQISVLIDVDVGLHRTGVQPGAPALRLARHIASLPELRLIGVQGYEGHVQHVHNYGERKRQCLEAMAKLTSTADLLRENGFHIEVVTAGGTGTAEICASVPGVTEIQPGSFIFMDTDYRGVLGPDSYANALTVLTTVVSKQGPRRATIDAGLKALSTDSGLAECKDPRYKHTNMGDEHGCLTWEVGTPDLNVGDKVEMIPSHIDPTVNLHDKYWFYRGEYILGEWTVDAKGKTQ